MKIYKPRAYKQLFTVSLGRRYVHPGKQIIICKDQRLSSSTLIAENTRELK